MYSMPLNSREIRVLQLINRCYFYAWKFPVTWNSPHYTRPNISFLVPYTLAVITIATFAFCSLAAATFINFFQTQQGIIHVIIMGTVGSLLTAILFFCLVFLFDPKLILFLENLMQTADCMFKGKHVFVIYRLFPVIRTLNSLQ